MLNSSKWFLFRVGGGTCWSVVYRCVNKKTARKGTLFELGSAVERGGGFYSTTEESSLIREVHPPLECNI